MPSGFARVGGQVCQNHAGALVTRGRGGDLILLPPSVCLLGFCSVGVAGLALSEPPLARAPHAPLPAPRVQVEFYVNENTFKERLKLFFIKNQRSSEWGPMGGGACGGGRVGGGGFVSEPGGLCGSGAGAEEELCQ